MWRLRRELHGLRLWQFLSRKFLRWLTLIPMALALVSSFFLRDRQLFGAVFFLQMTFYGSAVLGFWQRGTSRIFGLLRLPFVFVMANAAVLVGVIDACRRRTFATWNIAELSRGPDAQGS